MDKPLRPICDACGRPAVVLHGDVWYCGYHKPAFSERTRKGPFKGYERGSRRSAATATPLEHVRARVEPPPPPRKAEHYKVVAISLYTADQVRLRELVKAAREGGVRRATKSSIIRYALTLLDVTKLPEILP